MYAFDIYLNSKIDDALQSNDFLTRVLSIFDYRIGKRKLFEIKQYLNEMPEWLQTFYKIRLAVDNI